MRSRRSDTNTGAHTLAIEHRVVTSSRPPLPRRSWRERLTSFVAAVIASAAVICSQFALAALCSRQADIRLAEKQPVGTAALPVDAPRCAPKVTSGPFIEESAR